MARLNIAPKTTPLLDALLSQANDNAKRIRQIRRYTADTKEYWHFISHFCDKLKKTHTRSPSEVTPLEAADLMTRQALLLDQIFRNLYELGPKRNDFNLVLRSALLGLKAIKQARKIRRNARQIDERNKQNDKRNSQETPNAPMDGRSAESPIRKNETIETLVENNRPKNGRRKEIIFSERLQTWAEIRSDQRITQGFAPTSRIFEESITLPLIVIASEARQSRISLQLPHSGLPRRGAPRNDDLKHGSRLHPP